MLDYPKEPFYNQLSMPDNSHNKRVIVYAALLKANWHAYSRAIVFQFWIRRALETGLLGDSIEQECIEFGQKHLALSVYKEGKHLTLIDHKM